MGYCIQQQTGTYRANACDHFFHVDESHIAQLGNNLLERGQLSMPARVATELQKAGKCEDGSRIRIETRHNMLHLVAIMSPKILECRMWCRCGQPFGRVIQTQVDNFPNIQAR